MGSTDPEIVEYAQQLLAAIADDEATEIICNSPNEIITKVKGQRFHLPNLQFKDTATYHAVLDAALSPHLDTEERLHESPGLLVSQLELASLDGGPSTKARVHMLTPPVVAEAKVTIAKKARHAYNLDDIVELGAMSAPMGEFLKAAARGRMNIVVSGVTGSGKTTLLQALGSYYDINDRIVVIEETAEIDMPIADVVYLQTDVQRPGKVSDDQITMEWLVRQTQMMRMDRVIVGEVKGPEMTEFLIAANSGADGSCTTVHADSPRRALDKMLTLATKSRNTASEAALQREIAATVDLIVQLNLIDGKHVVTAIEEVPGGVTAGDAKVVVSQPLFEYDRATKQHRASGSPSDQMLLILANRGVPVAKEWFTTSGRRR